MTRRPAGSRGSVLVHVLLSSVLMLIIATGLLTFLTVQHRMNDRAAKSTWHKKEDEKILAAMVYRWNQPSVAFCSDFVAGSYTMTCGAGADADCTKVCPTCDACSCYRTSPPKNLPKICLSGESSPGAPRKTVVISADLPSP